VRAPHPTPPAVAFVVICLAVLGWTAATRWPGLNPQTLWADDVWVGAMTRLPLSTALSLPAPLPPGFVAMLTGMRALVADPEVSLQILPFVFGLIGPFVLALLVATVTGSRALGVVAICLGVLSPFLAHYSIFVKQYTLDFTMAAGLLLAGAFATRGRGLPLPWLATLTLAATPFSIPSVFVGVPLVHIVAARQGWQARRDRRSVARAAGWVVAFDLLLAAIYMLVLAGRRNAALTATWRADFLPLSSIGDATAFLETNGIGMLATAVPEGWTWVTALAVVGLLGLLARREWRPLGAVFASAYLAILAASGMGMYPIGSEFRARPMLFSHALTLCLVVAGVDVLRRVLPRPAWIGTVLAAAAVAVAVWRPVPVAYFPLDHSALVQQLAIRAGSADAIVLNLPAAYLTGYYGPWPIDAIRDPSPQGFAVILLRPKSLTLPRGAEENNPASPALDEFLARERPGRAFFFSSRRGIDAVQATFAARGYAEYARATSRVSTFLLTYIRGAE
jgi:hypothetical protein